MASRAGFVYLMRMGAYHKIGASIAPTVRLEAFSNLPYPVRLVHTIVSRNYGQVEAALHRRFQKVRKNGEWFGLTEDDVAAIKKIWRCDTANDLPDGLRPPSLPVPLPSGFASRLRELRTLAKLTQRRLGAIASEPAIDVNSLERGLQEPSWAMVILLADALGVTTDAFRLPPGATPAPPARLPRGRPKKQKEG